MAMEPTEPHPPETPQDPPAVQDAVWRVRAADAAMRWIPPPPSTVAPRPEREVRKKAVAMAEVQQAAAVAPYFPADARAKWFLEGMTLLEEDRKVSRKPPLWPMRDTYNAHTPLTIVDEGVWLMRARNAARRTDAPTENGTKATPRWAPGSEATRPRSRDATHSPTLNTNDIAEGHTDAPALTKALQKLNWHAGAAGAGTYRRNGANRSSVVAAAYLMARSRLPAKQVVQHLMALRPLVDVS
jgi:hypothetical protein